MFLSMCMIVLLTKASIGLYVAVSQLSYEYRLLLLHSMWRFK